MPGISYGFHMARSRVFTVLIPVFRIVALRVCSGPHATNMTYYIIGVTEISTRT